MFTQTLLTIFILSSAFLFTKKAEETADKN